MPLRCFLLSEIDNVLYIYLCGIWEQEKELVQLKREARLKGGFYVSPEAKLLFVIRIRGYDTYSRLCDNYIDVDDGSFMNFMLLFDSNFVKLQYQCHAPEDQEDLAAFAFEAGGFADKLVLQLHLLFDIFLVHIKLNI